MTIRQNIVRQIFQESLALKISPVKNLRYMVCTQLSAATKRNTSFVENCDKMYPISDKKFNTIKVGRILTYNILMK